MNNAKSGARTNKHQAQSNAHGSHLVQSRAPLLHMFFAASDLSQESTETTPTPNRLTEDTTNNHTPPTLVTEHDLFWYGVAQGISNLSNKAPFLTVWLNRIWTLDLEESRTEWVVATERTRYAETLTGHVERLADYIHIPDALPQDEAHNQEHTDTINFEQFTINRYINDINRDYPRTLAQYNQEGIWTHTFTHDTGILGVNGTIALDTQGGREHLLTDGRGSITEALGSDITTYRYDAFGNVQRQGNSLNPFTYNQERFDFASGLQFLRARYVDLSLGRFISRDTVLGTLEDPRTHNLYLYVQNDPLNAIDPSVSPAV